MKIATSKIYSSSFRGKKQRDFSHPSVVALLEANSDCPDPEEIIRRKCREIVSSAKKCSWSGPPFDPFILASFRGIKVKKVTRDIGAEARIFGTRGQVIIEYRPDLALEERLRFSICHEIVHTLFPDCYEMVRHIKVGESGVSEAEREFERLCDIGAGELLMPHEDFAADLEKTPLALNDVCELKKRYHASTEAAVNRCLGITKLPRAAVFFHKPQHALAVKYYWKSNTFRPFIQPGLIPPDCSIVHNLEKTKSAEPMPQIAQKETWLAPDGKQIELHVQAISLQQVPGQPQYPTAMALVSPSAI